MGAASMDVAVTVLWAMAQQLSETVVDGCELFGPGSN